MLLTDLPDWIYEHPAYSKMEITLKNDGKLHMSYHTFECDLKHYHYDIFSVETEPIEGIKLTFLTNIKGKIDRVTSSLEPSVKEIEFTRIAETKKINFSKYTGIYEMGDMETTVSVRGDNTPTLIVPGQPTYELLKTNENEFDIKGLAGYSVCFSIIGDKASEIVFHQPNGTFTAKRKL